MKSQVKAIEGKLKSYQILGKQIINIKKKLEIIETGLFKIKTPNFSSSKGRQDEYKLENLLDKKTELQNELNYLKIQKNLIVEMVNILDGIEKELIIDIYFNNKSFSESAIKYGYSESGIRKVKQKAIIKLLNYSSRVICG